MSHASQVLTSVLFPVAFYLVCLVPGLLIFGALYVKFFNRIRRRKTLIWIYSLLGTLLAPINVYLGFYSFTDGWTNGNSEVILYVLVYSPFIFIGFLIAFAIMYRMKKRGQVNGDRATM